MLTEAARVEAAQRARTLMARAVAAHSAPIGGRCASTGAGGAGGVDASLGRAVTVARSPQATAKEITREARDPVSL